MKTKILFFFSLIICITLSGCFFAGNTDNTAEPVTIEFFAMDTYMRISAYGSGAELAVAEAREAVEKLDDLWSVNSENSEIFLLNNTGYAAVSPDTTQIIKTAMEIASETGHAFDISVYPIVKAWGFTTGEYNIPGDMEISALLQFVGSDMIGVENDNIRLPENMMLDLGAIAKGYAAQCVMDIMENHGVESAIAVLGGNVQALGTKPDSALWRIAIQDPLASDEYAGTLLTSDNAVVTSGIYQRYFVEDGKTYHHLIDPASGRPADNGLLSVTIITEDGTTADALSTAMFVMGQDMAIDFWRNNNTYDFQMIIITNNGNLIYTNGLTGIFTPDAERYKVEIAVR